MKSKMKSKMVLFERTLVGSSVRIKGIEELLIEGFVTFTFSKKMEIKRLPVAVFRSGNLSIGYYLPILSFFHDKTLLNNFQDNYKFQIVHKTLTEYLIENVQPKNLIVRFYLGDEKLIQPKRHLRSLNLNILEAL